MNLTPILFWWESIR